MTNYFLITIDRFVNVDKVFFYLGELTPFLSLQITQTNKSIVTTALPCFPKKPTP
jgi:hypothetical protein